GGAIRGVEGLRERRREASGGAGTRARLIFERYPGSSGISSAVTPHFPRAGPSRLGRTPITAGSAPVHPHGQEALQARARDGPHVPWRNATALRVRTWAVGSTAAIQATVPGGGSSTDVDTPSETSLARAA